MACSYSIDVNCAFIPEEITHEAHADHLLTRVDAASSSSSSRMECRACRVGIDEGDTYFRCNACDFYLDCGCALHLPKTIRNKCDKHPLQLSYSPVEDHRSEYFCEVCEEGLDPGKWFYHCVKWAQSIHSVCAPLILQSEQGVNSAHLKGVYKFINFKFGFVVQRPGYHQHPLLCVPGTENDVCRTCESKLQSMMIFKCLQCNAAFHANLTDLINQSCISKYLTLMRKKYLGFYKEYRPYRPDQSKLEEFYDFYPREMIRPVTRNWKVVDDKIGEALL